MIILDYDMIGNQLTRCDHCTIHLRCLDDGDVYSMLGKTAGAHSVPGSLAIVGDLDQVTPSRFGHTSDVVRVALTRASEPNSEQSGVLYYAIGWSCRNAAWIAEEVKCVSLRHQLFSRFGGILETDAVAGKTVLVIGVGSFGSEVVVSLAKSGVTSFILMDDDRLEVGNIMRHCAGVSQVGRFKTKAVCDAILDKNPLAKVTTVEKRVEPQTMGLLGELAADPQVVICVTDNRDSRLLVNRICVEQRKICFFSGAYRRAYGGQILRVRPYEGPCYQCFLMSLPAEASNEEVSSARQAQAISYSDRIVPVEPGLANDIAPMNQMLSKLVIQELLKDKETTLRSLDEDLSAPMYIWFNRREVGTEQQQWGPLEFDVDGFHVMRWYGAPLPMNPGCPVCGDFMTTFAEQHGLSAPETRK